MRAVASACLAASEAASEAAGGAIAGVGSGGFGAGGFGTGAALPPAAAAAGWGNWGAAPEAISSMVLINSSRCTTPASFSPARASIGFVRICLAITSACGFRSGSICCTSAVRPFSSSLPRIPKACTIHWMMRVTLMLTTSMITENPIRMSNDFNIRNLRSAKVAEIYPDVKGILMVF